jgi:hypothetical protein
MRGLAINVGANTNEPGFRGPVDADGRFAYVPIRDRTGGVGSNGRPAAECYHR